jgi:hypothetical protein
MATVISKTVDVQHGCVNVGIKDDVPSVGNVTQHTIYVTGPNAVTDVNAQIAALCTQADIWAAQISNAMQALGQ